MASLRVLESRRSVGSDSVATELARNVSTPACAPMICVCDQAPMRRSLKADQGNVRCRRTSRRPSASRVRPAMRVFPAPELPAITCSTLHRLLEQIYRWTTASNSSPIAELISGNGLTHRVALVNHIDLLPSSRRPRGMPVSLNASIRWAHLLADRTESAPVQESRCCCASLNSPRMTLRVHCFNQVDDFAGF